jgi:hypothetical protein
LEIAIEVPFNVRSRSIARVHQLGRAGGCRIIDFRQTATIARLPSWRGMAVEPARRKSWLMVRRFVRCPHSAARSGQ